MKLGKVKVRLTPGGERVSFPVHLAETPQEGIDMLGEEKALQALNHNLKRDKQRRIHHLLASILKKSPQERNRILCALEKITKETQT